jgi:hypothetical protein
MKRARDTTATATAVRSSSRTRHAHPTFVCWLNSTIGDLSMGDTTFSSFEAVFKALNVNGRPTRVQSGPANCTIYSLWTAVEVMLGALPEPPPWMKTKIPTGTGLPMDALQSKEAVRRFLAARGLTASERVTGRSADLVRQAMLRGVVLAGIKINMFDDDTHVRGRAVKRELLDRAGQPSGKLGNCMIDHSVCFVGYCEVRGKGYVITKDTQAPEDFGCKGCALLPIEEAVGSEVELYVLGRK